MSIFIPLSEVEKHSSRHSVWVVVEGYVLDLTSFLDHHPGSAGKILSKRKKHFDITSNFIDHFRHTVNTFRRACRDYENQNESVHQPLSFSFQETPDVHVTILGKIEM